MSILRGTRRIPRILSVFWHGVESDSMPVSLDSSNPPVTLFRAQLQHLIDNYTPISVWDFLAIVDGGHSIDAYARPPVLLGFDDGFRSVITNGLPILTRLGVPAVFFVLGESLGNPKFLPWFVEMRHMIRRARRKRVVYHGFNLDLACPEDGWKARRLIDEDFRACQSEAERHRLLRDLAELVGVSRPVADEVDEDLRSVRKEDLTQVDASSVLAVASHAMTHRYLPALPYEEQLYELHQSDSVLRENVPAYCPVVAYPGGSFNAATIAIARNIYRAGFAVLLGSSYHNRYAYPRVGLGKDTAREIAYGVSSIRLNLLVPLKRWLCVGGLRRIGG